MIGNNYKLIFKTYSKNLQKKLNLEFITQLNKL